MNTALHSFSIPVMGTGHSIDSPIRVGPYGIDSVISIVDDLLIEKIRKHYSTMLDKTYNNIPRNAEDGRARRITAYLNLVGEVVQEKFEEIRSQPFFEDNEKSKYFELLPPGSTLRMLYDDLMNSDPGTSRDKLACDLARQMRPGSIDVNIMAKVDGMQYDRGGQPLSPEFSDANAALRGFARSKISSSLVLSAGFNPRLYNYITEFRDFYRNAKGKLRKKIILKVSDFRSALIQGRYLAKKGLEVFEYRIESGLNCGGHAFASEGLLLPTLLKEFRDRRDDLVNATRPLIEKFYEEEREGFREEWEPMEPRITVQGGIGNSGEARRLQEQYGMDATGWGSPFLMVPEATAVDTPTRTLLQEAREEDLYLSGVSPLGIPFNNIRNTGSHRYHAERIEKDKPGSPCPKGFLESNTEFTDQPICTASHQYQLLKLDEIARSEMPETEKESEREKVLDKACLCDHLGNGALIALGMLEEHRAPQAICPGPNIAWFDRTYTLKEMVDHIYGRGESLVPDERPHMFAKEMGMYVDYLEEQLRSETEDRESMKKFRNNLQKGIAYCREVAATTPYEGENLDSLQREADRQMERIESIWAMADPVTSA